MENNLSQEENKYMVLNNAESIKHHAEELENAAKKSKHIPAWAVAKIYNASENLSGVTHFIDSSNKMPKEQYERIQEQINEEVKNEYAQGGGIEDYIQLQSNIGSICNKNGVTLKDYHEAKKFYTGGVIDSCETIVNGERQIDADSINKLTECVMDLPQTKSYYLDSKGNYTSSRKQLHKKIINQVKKGVVCIDKGKPIAVLMGGSPASGKTTFLKKYRPYLLSESIFKVDADEIRSMLPEYKGYNASQTHEETSDIVNTLISDKNIGIPCEFDFIYDGTMSSPKKYFKLVELLKNLGYEVFIIFMNGITEKTAKERALQRYKKSGRFVPMSVIEDFFRNGKETLNKLKNLVDGYIVVDGSTPEYNIIEQSGIRLPNERIYEELGNVKLKQGGNTTRKDIIRDTKNKLSKAFTLPIEMSVYVPSTASANEEISEEEFNDRIEEVEVYLSNLFGGFSKVDISGGYNSEEKGLIQESVAKVTAFATKKSFEENKNKLIEKLSYWCKEWGQESMGYEFEGDLYYIDKNFKLENGGGVDFKIPPQGTMISKDKKNKLDYKKVGNNYEFIVYEGEPNPVENYSRTSFKKKTNGVVTMNYNQFINYIYTEGYVDDKMAQGGGIGRIVMIPTFVVKEIKESVKMGYDNLVEGMIGRKRKGVMLINENYEVRGTYDIGLKDAIQDLINQIKSGNFKIDAVDNKMADGGGVEDEGGNIMILSYAKPYKGKGLVKLRKEADEYIKFLQSNNFNVHSGSDALYFPDFTWANGKQKFGDCIAVMAGSETVMLTPIGENKKYRFNEKLLSRFVKDGRKTAYLIKGSQFEKGGGVGKKPKTEYTISDFIKLQKQKLREHNSKAHPDDQLDWNDWKYEIENSEAKDYGIFFNKRMQDNNGDRGVFEYMPTNKNYTEEYRIGGGVGENIKKSIIDILKELHSFSNKIKFRTEWVNGIWNIVYDDPKGETEYLLKRLRNNKFWNTDFAPTTGKFPGGRVNITFDKSAQEILNVEKFDKKDWLSNQYAKGGGVEDSFKDFKYKDGRQVKKGDFIQLPYSKYGFHPQQESIIEKYEVIGVDDTYRTPRLIVSQNGDMKNLTADMVSQYMPYNRMAKGGATMAQKRKVGKVMHEWKAGKLHSGSKKGPIVKDQKQAVAIALSEAGLSKNEKLKKENNLKKTNMKKMPTALDKWRKHLEQVRKQNPSKSLKECMTIAKKSYKK